MKVVLVAGARPNFMKIAPIIKAIKKAELEGEDISYELVHTGQHYDKKLSQQFFDELSIPEPDVNLSVGSGSHASQTAAIMVAFEEYLLNNPCDLVLVVGDVNSTLAAVLVAKKLQIKAGHVEAGIRSFDMRMPEEINRLATDSICDYFYTTTEWAGDNLKEAGAKEEQIFFVGNTMIDTLLSNKERFKKPSCLTDLGINSGAYLLSTLHRPSNVDDANNLATIIEELSKPGLPVVLPCHPRTKPKIESIQDLPPNIHLVDPLGYLEFMYLVENSFAVVTDSGGIQEETTVLGVPCFTLRENTERPETIDVGTNVLLGVEYSLISKSIASLQSGTVKEGGIPDKWDGKTAERIVEAIISHG